MDAFDFFAAYLDGEFEEAAAFHCSPPCQGYSIMNSLPWLKGRDYPLLILPTMEILEQIGRPYVLENVMGARYGAKGLLKRGLEAHGLQAGYLCGTMFGLPFYRHRLFATNWFWLAPGHPKHQQRIFYRSEDSLDSPRPRGTWEQRRGGTLPKSKHGPGGAGLTIGGNFDRWRASGNPMAALMGKMATLGKYQNCAQAGGCGIGHAKGWRAAAKAMDIDWMRREELTQAIPPVYTLFIGNELRRILDGRDQCI